MNFSLTSEQRELRAVARSFFESNRSSDGLTVGARWDRSTWDLATKQVGLVGLAVPEALGGQGGGMLEAALLMHESGRALSMEPFMASVGLTLPILLAAAHTDEVEEIVPAICSGDMVPGFALVTSRSAVSRLAVDDSGSALSISGLVNGVVDAQMADAFVVLLDNGELARLFLVGRTDRTVVIDHPSIDLTRSYGIVRFVGAPARELAAGTSGAIRDGLRGARTILAGELVGCAEACVEATTAYVQERQQFGRPVGGFQAVKHRLVDMFVELELARAAVEYAAGLGNDSGEAPAADLVALAAATRAAEVATREAIHLHGGIGFTWELDLHRYMRRTRAIDSFLGGRSNTLRRIVSARPWMSRRSVDSPDE